MRWSLFTISLFILGLIICALVFLCTFERLLFIFRNSELFDWNPLRLFS